MGSNQSKLGEDINKYKEAKEEVSGVDADGILVGKDAKNLYEAFLKTYEAYPEKKQQEYQEEWKLAYHNTRWDIIEVSGMNNMFV